MGRKKKKKKKEAHRGRPFGGATLNGKMEGSKSAFFGALCIVYV